jgi:hypothetical protein
MSRHTITRRRFAAAIGLGGLTLPGSGVVGARGHARNFRTHLSGENEVPAVETKAQGQAKFQLDKAGDELSYKLIVANIENVLMAHIHLGARDENGPVVVWLFPEDGPPPVLIEGRFSGVFAEDTITDDDLVGPLAVESLADLLAEMRDGNTYVNVHTTAHPPGEIRGQIH